MSFEQFEECGWNYRLVSKEFNGEITIGIHEVYYTEGEPTSCTIEPITIIGDTKAGVQIKLNMIAGCMNRPVLKYEEILKHLEYIIMKEY